MSAGWSNEEIIALLGVWGVAGVENQLDGVSCDRNVYQTVASALADQGVNHTW